MRDFNEIINKYYGGVSSVVKALLFASIAVIIMLLIGGAFIEVGKLLFGAEPIVKVQKIN